MLRNVITSLFSVFLGLMLFVPSATALTSMDPDPDSYPDPAVPFCTVVCNPLASCSLACTISTKPEEVSFSTCGQFGACAMPVPTPPAPPPPESPSTICSTTTPIPALSVIKGGSKSHSFGSKFVGASYSASASLVATTATPTLPATIKTDGSMSANGSLFWKTYTLAKGAFQSVVKQGISATGSVTLSIVGNVVYSTTLSNQGILLSKTFSKTFFGASYTVSILGFPVTVQGKVAGSVGVSLAGALLLSGGTVTFVPSAKAYATASASVGALGVGVGVSGSITLIDVSAPASLSATLADAALGPNLGWGISLKVVLKTLSGKLKVFVDYIFDSASWTIFSWSGYSKSFTIFDLKGCAKLIPLVSSTSSKM